MSDDPYLKRAEYAQKIDGYVGELLVGIGAGGIRDALYSIINRERREAYDKGVADTEARLKQTTRWVAGWV